MATIIKVVGQITLQVHKDTVSTTYFYLLQPSTASVPTKPTTSPPPVISTEGYTGWSTVEPGYTLGDTSDLYTTIRVVYSDGSFEYTDPSLSSSYEAAKQAYNQAKAAELLANAVDARTQQFWWNSSASPNYPVGAYAASGIEGIKLKTNDSSTYGYNTYLASNKLALRYNDIDLTKLTTGSLEFYIPKWEGSNPVQGEKGLEITNSAITFYNPSTNNAQLIIGANGTLQSGNYNYRTDLAEKRFSLAGTKIDLIKGDIITPKFRLASGEIDSISAGAYIQGTIEALDGYIQKMYIGTDSTNRWEVGNISNYDQSTSAALISNGTAFIQLGRQNTWRLSTDRIHTAWIASNSTALTFPTYEGKYWDWGTHSPHKAGETWKDKFLYIRNSNTNDNTIQALVQDLDDDIGLWNYQFWIDRNGNITTTGTIDAHNITIDGVSIAGGSLIAGSLSSYAGSSIRPVYFPSEGNNQGKPVAIDYTIESNVPANAKFTDTVTSIAYNTTSKKITQTIDGSTTDVVTLATLKTDLGSMPASDVCEWAKASTKPTYTAAEVGALASTLKGANSGVAELDEDGKVPSSQLPSYVDDVLEFTNFNTFPIEGESGKIYIAVDTNRTYRWSGTQYTEISSSLSLGETSSTAYRGDRGKIAYDHATAKGSAFTSGLYKITTNAEGHVTAAVEATKSDIGLANVENKSSADIRSEITAENIPSISKAKINDFPTTWALSDITGADDLKAIEALSGTKGLLKKTANNTWTLDTNTYLTSYTETDPIFIQSVAHSITSDDIDNWNSKTSNTGTVTSVRIRATSPVTSSVSTASSTTLDTTIALAEGYGDTKNPYKSKTARYVLAAPASGDGVPSFRALTNADVGLSNVENKTSATILGELTSSNVTTALGFTPYNSTNPSGYITSSDAGVVDIGPDDGNGKLRVYFNTEQDTQGHKYKDVTVKITATTADTAAQADKLSTEGTVITNLGTTGTNAAKKYTEGGNIEPGVKGTLGVANGGTGATSFTANSLIISGNTTTAALTTRAIATSIAASSTSTNIPTAAAVASFVEGKGYKTTDNNTTYTFSGGTGKFTVTPSVGNSYDVTIASSYTLPIATFNVLGGAIPWFSTTGASTLASGSTQAYTNNPQINARTTVTGKYYAIEVDKNGRLFVNVPWENSTDLTGAVTSISTTAGAHETITNTKGNVSFKIPTDTTHLTNGAKFAAVQIVRWS